MSYIRLNRENSRYESAISFGVLDSEIYRQACMFFGNKMPKSPDTVCVLSLRHNSIQYYFCDMYYCESDFDLVCQRNEDAVVYVVDITVGMKSPLYVRYLYVIEKDEKDKTFFETFNNNNNN